MFSSPYQLGAISLLFFLVLITIWHRHDQRKKEPFFLLAAFFIISTLASFAFYSWKNYSLEINGLLVQYDSYLLWLFPFLEELLKAATLIFVLELAQEKFDEINDGLIYGAVVAMGFVFIENTVFTLSAPAGTGGILFFLRSFFTNALHMITTMYFGYFYANGYLNRNKKLFDKKNLSKPHEILRHFRSYIRRYVKKIHIFALPYALFRIITLHITRNRIILRKKSSVGKPHRSGEFILEGFLGALYLHWFYNFSYTIQSSLIQILAMIIPLILIGIIFVRFNQIDQNPSTLKPAPKVVT